MEQIKSKLKALITLFPYAVQLERDGDRRIFDAYFNIFVAPKARELVAKPIIGLLGEASLNSPNWAVTLMLPYRDWGLKCNHNTLTGWAGAALAVSYTEKIGQSVVDTLLQIARVNQFLEPSISIPIDIWAFLKKRPSLPPAFTGLKDGTMPYVVRKVRELGDVEILESYLVIAWSEWNTICSGGVPEMCTSISKGLGGIGMWRRREVLTKHLDHVRGGLERERLKQRDPSIYSDPLLGRNVQYGQLMWSLIDEDRKALRVLTSTPFRLFSSLGSLTPVDVHRVPLHVHVRAPSPVSVSCASTALAPRSPNSTLPLHVGSRQSPLYASPATFRHKKRAASIPSVEIIRPVGGCVACVIVFVL